jgi:phosphoglycerate dehydrogenase-like enzyme
MAQRRLKVLFLPTLVELKEPWERDVVQTIGPKHDLTFYKYDEPVAPQFQGVDVVVDFAGDRVTREMADAASSVKLWHLLLTGYDHFDVKYWNAKNIPVANCPGVFAGLAMAECAIMFMIMLSRQWHETQACLSQGVFYRPLGYELENRVLGMVGFGATAQALASKAKAFSMRMMAIDIRDMSQDERSEFGLEFVGKPRDLDELIPKCDFLSLHLQLNAETRHIIDARRLALMKSTAFLLNLARGALVDEKALYAALAANQLGGAGLDVFSREPLDPNDPILKLKNVVATTHNSSVTDGTSRRRVGCVAENIDRIANGLPPLYLLAM